MWKNPENCNTFQKFINVIEKNIKTLTEIKFNN